MNSTTPANLKEIAEQLSFDFRAFMHKETEQLLFVPNEDQLDESDPDLWAEELEILENNSADYYEIEKWTSVEAFKIMEGFAEQLTGNDQLQQELSDALSKRHPFREFKSVIEDADDYSQAWFAYKNKAEIDLVDRQLTGLKLDNE